MLHNNSVQVWILDWNKYDVSNFHFQICIFRFVDFPLSDNGEPAPLAKSATKNKMPRNAFRWIYILYSSKIFSNLFFFRLTTIPNWQCCFLRKDEKGRHIKGSASWKILQICPKLFYFIHEYACLLPERSAISEKLAKNTGPSGRTAP